MLKTLSEHRRSITTRSRAGEILETRVVDFLLYHKLFSDAPELLSLFQTQDQYLRFDQDLEDWILLLLLLLLPFKNSSEHDTMRGVHASESEEAKTKICFTGVRRSSLTTGL
jgi:hypothetical protein